VLLIPALDLRAGRVVRLRQGDFGQERSYPVDAVDLARSYADAGCRRLHVVDLDAARGSGDNRGLVERLVAETGVEVQVAGGVRTAAGAERWLAEGAAAVVMGTAAVREPRLLAGVAAANPGRVLAALDVRSGRPAVAGWAAVDDLTVPALLHLWAGAPVAGVILTSVDRDGTLGGPDVGLLTGAIAATSHPVVYSGGIASLDDLRAVSAAGAAGAILGRSLLEDRLPLREALSVLRK
jgi:phosphoribosylformimino-5-aminoimidazole carboxamide ribotide isomerase